MREDSDAAFAEIVDRHARWVFAAAFRQLGDRELAEDATQSVFVLLAQRCHRMSSNQKLTGWLFNTLGYTVKNLRRQRMRRQMYERQAALERTEAIETPERIDDLAVHLDAAVASLSQTDRNVILLRFYQDRSFEEIADAMGITAATARKRVSRGTEKLHRYFIKTGATPARDAAAVSAAALWGMNQAPTTLAQSVARVSLAAKTGAGIPAAILTTSKGAAYLMAATKIKILAAVVLVCVVAIPAAVVAVRWGPSLFAQPVASTSTAIDAPPIDTVNPQEAWRVENLSSDMVAGLGPEVQVLPTKFPNSENFLVVAARPSSDKVVGIHAPVALIASVAYHVSPGRIVFADGAPSQRYDFISTLEQNSSVELQQELQSKTGLIGRREMRDMEVMTLKSETPNAPGLAPPTPSTDFFLSMQAGTGRIKSVQNLRSLAFLLEQFLQAPIDDQSGMKENFSIDFSWKQPAGPNHDALKQALRDQLGVTLTPGHASIEVLVLEKAK